MTNQANEQRDQSGGSTHFRRLGVIGGSGLGDLTRFGIAMSDAEEVDVDTPFGPPSDKIVLGSWEGVPLALLRRHGRDHELMPSAVPYRANILALREVGCTHIVASGATGSLREEIAPGDLVIVDQLIDRTDGRPRTFFERAAVHVEFADPCCPVLRRWLLEASKSLESVCTHDGGTYVCIEGPSFSTRAEAHMHRAWGADVVGMTALPEARLAREACMAYALIALPTDYDCWRERPGDSKSGESLLREIIGNLKVAAEASLTLLAQAIRDVSLLRAEPSPAHHALDLAVWTPEKALGEGDRQTVGTLR